MSTADDHSALMAGSPMPAQPVRPAGAIAAWTAGVTAASAVLVSVGSYAAPWAGLSAVLAAVLVLSWGWPALLDLPDQRVTTVVVALGGTACALAVWLVDVEPRLRWLALALAGSVVVEFVHQLMRRDGRPRMVESVSGTVSAVMVLASYAAVLALPAALPGSAGVLVWAAPVALAMLVQALPLPGRVTAVLGLAVGALCAGLIAGLLIDGARGTALLAGLVTGGTCSGVAVMTHRLLAALPAAGRAPGWLALAVAPWASSGMIGYVTLRLLLG